MLEIIKIKETCLYIRDLQKAYEFYHFKLELPIIDYVREKHLFLRVGSSVLLCFNPEDSALKSSPPAHYAKGKLHLAFEVSHDKYNSTKKLLESAGVEIIDEVVWKNGSSSFYFEDPDGNVLEIVPAGIWD
jgi:catechol 2,3-dioxygenase-like lactoylglutathione lyase family enzyme